MTTFSSLPSDKETSDSGQRGQAEALITRDKGWDGGVCLRGGPQVCVFVVEKGVQEMTL